MSGHNPDSPPAYINILYTSFQSAPEENDQNVMGEVQAVPTPESIVVQTHHVVVYNRNTQCCQQLHHEVQHIFSAQYQPIFQARGKF